MIVSSTKTRFLIALVAPAGHRRATVGSRRGRQDRSAESGAGDRETMGHDDQASGTGLHAHQPADVAPVISVQSAFRVTHRFVRPLASAVGGLAGDLFGLDSERRLGSSIASGSCRTARILNDEPHSGRSARIGILYSSPRYNRRLETNVDVARRAKSYQEVDRCMPNGFADDSS